ncbi:SDR family oxidoreductase [Arthrobacter sp. W4I7]|uniref:SDR family oxidoreductase n=1 Tax=Arthrobacter sp. W4I7 TaxID=3042296 RepID=UPI00278B1128|nr:SDR family oxidoreductase [Arthrobacter sp. W4I7]MDQ0691383.1 NAD(P)-dependent dehydrogenase (short-subunit alcohol dehydrogenase family) [Arthrobacter sp. W4I7]
MRIKDRIVAVTGGGQGLGRAMVEDVLARGARVVAVLDVDGAAARGTAAEMSGTVIAVEADVASEESLRAAIDHIRSEAGPIDVFISNAGIADIHTSPFTDDAVWERNWRVNAMSNVYAARILLPEMLERGSGHLVATASSNALTSNPLDMAYAVSKHAQLAVAEWLAMTYGEAGIGVTCFCPKGMSTPMLRATAASGDPYAMKALKSAVTPAEAATICLDAVEADRFMAVTYLPVVEEFALKGRDYEAWIASAQAMHRELAPGAGRA